MPVSTAFFGFTVPRTGFGELFVKPKNPLARKLTGLLDYVADNNSFPLWVN